jgi:hypothetical protein
MALGHVCNTPIHGRARFLLLKQGESERKQDRKRSERRQEITQRRIEDSTVTLQVKGDVSVDQDGSSGGVRN